ncbi:hypothetical protein ABZV77_15340 [Streptomyces sp. NPDC004732]|uniref:hypothetical protein n=1 Tax=Streptomyces sp. NPDC004732 TaxID=3154290 RepID=UPI0033B6B374
MDAAIAGLIGALGGAALGAGGAWGAAKIALQGAKYQADRTAEAAHAQWLRQLRREAYVQLLGTCRGLHRDMTIAMYNRRFMNREEREAETRRFTETLEELDTAMMTARLEADETVADLISETLLTFGMFSGYFVGQGEGTDTLDPHLARFEEQMREQLKRTEKYARDSLQAPDGAPSHLTWTGILPTFDDPARPAS